MLTSSKFQPLHTAVCLRHDTGFRFGFSLPSELGFLTRFASLPVRVRTHDHPPPCCCLYNNNTTTGGFQRGEDTSANAHRKQTPQPDPRRLAKRLKQVGIHDDTIQELLVHYPQETIQKQLSYLPYRNATNPAGLLVKAIKADWSPPTGYQETKAQETKPTSTFNPAQEALARLQAEAAAQQPIRQKLSVIASQLSKKRKQSLLLEAETRIRKRLRTAWPKEKPIPRTFLKAEFYCLLKAQFLKPPTGKKSDGESTDGCPDDTH